ncbi:MAG: TolC family protein [Bacteroidetes bacterium]|nr:TolC family protein [Bacteroidota bacterium]
MKKIFLSAVSFVIFVLQIQAQVQVNKDLKNLINHSFGYFPKLKEAANSVITAEDKIALTQTASNPTIGAQAGYLYMAPVSKVTFPGSTETFKFVPNHNYTTSVNANYVLADFGRIKANVERAKVDLEFAKDNIELIKSQLANQVATIYYNMVYLQKAISIQDSVLNFLTENKKIVQSKLNDGEALKIDLLNIQANIDNEENRKVDLKNSLQKQLNLLNYTTGTNAPAGNSFDFGIATVNSQTALDSSVINNLDFKIAKDKINQANGDINIAKLLDKPSITMNGGVGFKNGYIPDIYNVQFNGLAGITLNIPLYSGGRTKQQVKLQEHLVQQQQLALESLNANYKKDIAQAMTDIQTNIERIGNTQSQIDQAKYAQQLAAIRFKNGVGTNLELTNASTNVQRAEFSKLQYQYQLCISKLELARLMGYQYW